MKAAELRRHLSDADLERLARASDDARTEVGFRAILDRLAGEEKLFAFSKHLRDKIAYRAARLLHTPSPASPSVRAALAKGKWRARAAAASALLRSGRAVRSAGSLGIAAASRRGHSRDGVEAARALATALRETAAPGVVEAQARLRDASAALRLERGGRHVWEKAMTPLLSEFARNAGAAGASRQEAALEALAAAAVLTGRARQGDEDDLPFQLGAAARTLSHEKKEAARETSAARRLASDLAAQNAVRLGLWDDLDSGEIRLLGASCARAVFGKGEWRAGARPAPSMAFDGAMLPEEWRDRFAHLTAYEAAAELGRMAADPRMNDDDRTRAELAAETAAAHPGAGHVSFAEALGVAAAPMRLERLRPGKLFRASPRGKFPARLHCRGKHGRLLRCRAAADARGALVGYLSFDPFSREIGGRPLFAAYDLEGKRQGYAWADEPAYLRFGAPEQGFVSAPESIPL